jgi:hypothetical protein
MKSTSHSAELKSTDSRFAIRKLYICSLALALALILARKQEYVGISFDRSIIVRQDRTKNDDEWKKVLLHSLSAIGGRSDQPRRASELLSEYKLAL